MPSGVGCVVRCSRKGDATVESVAGKEKTQWATGRLCTSDSPSDSLATACKVQEAVAEDDADDTEQEISAIFEHQESATTRVSFFVSFPRVGSKPSPSLSRSSRTRCNSGSASLFRSREQLPWVRAPWSLVGRNKPAAGRPFQLSC